MSDTQKEVENFQKMAYQVKIFLYIFLIAPFLLFLFVSSVFSAQWLGFERRDGWRVFLLLASGVP